MHGRASVGRDGARPLRASCGAILVTHGALHPLRGPLTRSAGRYAGEAVASRVRCAVAWGARVHIA